MKTKQPDVYVTFNGDFFDWPYLMVRSSQVINLPLLMWTPAAENEGSETAQLVRQATISGFTLARLFWVV